METSAIPGWSDFFTAAAGVAAGCILSILVAMLSAWVLRVEILR